MPTTPAETVEAFIDAFAAMDFDTALSHADDDCEYTNVALTTVTGPAGIREVLEPFFGPIPKNGFQILRRAAGGPVVFAERLDRHRLEHGWRELPVNSVFEVHNGKVTVWRDYFDVATMAKIHEPNA